MKKFLAMALGVLAAPIVIGWIADRCAQDVAAKVTPGLSLLPGDSKTESRNGRARFYFPVVTSIVVSIVLSLIVRLFR